MVHERWSNYPLRGYHWPNVPRPKVTYDWIIIESLKQRVKTKNLLSFQHLEWDVWRVRTTAHLLANRSFRSFTRTSLSFRSNGWYKTTSCTVWLFAHTHTHTKHNKKKQSLYCTADKKERYHHRITSDLTLIGHAFLSSSSSSGLRRTILWKTRSRGQSATDGCQNHGDDLVD